MDYRTADFLEGLEVQIEALKARSRTKEPAVVWKKNLIEELEMRGLMIEDIEKLAGGGHVYDYSCGVDDFGRVYALHVGLFTRETQDMPESLTENLMSGEIGIMYLLDRSGRNCAQHWEDGSGWITDCTDEFEGFGNSQEDYESPGLPIEYVDRNIMRVDFHTLF